MSAPLAFRFGPFLPDEAAHVEETGERRRTLLRRFPFVSGVLATDTGFAGRGWRAACLLKGATLEALAERRALLRSLSGTRDVLNVSGESFADVLLLPESLAFGPVRGGSDGFRQEAEMEFLQLTEGGE
ncbi:MAG: hypothetical protein DRH15_14890 [Deltaproteobacteria bacterium]|nr:MAG: hypothetical protein DRH15_14890 [Deltaproteobacteria bacterium]